MTKNKREVVANKHIIDGPPYKHTHEIPSFSSAVMTDALINNKSDMYSAEGPTEKMLLDYYLSILSGLINVRNEEGGNFYSTFLGHRWDNLDQTLTPSDVMCIVDKIGEDDYALIEEQRKKGNKDPDQLLLSGEAYDKITEICRGYGVDANTFYYTAIYKIIDPDIIYGIKNLKACYRKPWYPILDLEVSFVKPKLIILMGLEPAKWWFNNPQLRLIDVLGSVNYGTYYSEINIDPFLRKNLKENNVTAVVMNHPRISIVGKTAKDISSLRVGLNLAMDEYTGTRVHESVDHRIINNLPDLRRLAEEIKQDCEFNLVAIDCEWNSDHPENKNAYLRTIQISWADKKSAAIVTYNNKGQSLYTDVEKLEVISLIEGMLTGKQIAGHYVDSDMEYLLAYGIDILKYFTVPDTPEEYRRLVLSNSACGFDTALAAHAIEETDKFSLTAQYLKHTTAPRYETAIEDWKKQYKKDTGMTIDGYGVVPDSVLCPYGNYDADVTRRIAVRLKQMLLSDRYNHDNYIPFWANMRVIPAVLEMKRVGVLIDMELLDKLTHLYAEAFEEHRKKLQIYVGSTCTDYRLSSVYDRRYFLFGMGKHKENANTMGLKPLYATSKTKMDWDSVVSCGKEDMMNPSTDKNTLRLYLRTLSDKTYKDVASDKEFKCVDAIQEFMDCCALLKVLQSTVRPPNHLRGYEHCTYTCEFIRKGIKGSYDPDDESNPDDVYEKGIPESICGDGRVRTTFYTTLETGRWSSSRPNLQNLGKTAEENLQRIVGDKYIAPLRALIMADPGYLIVSSDYKGAELTAAATLSGDKAMLAHVKRSQLSEDDPDFYDIHSNIAVSTFKLDCAPTKKALKEAGLVHFRSLAKAVIFGIFYGRGAAAIAKQAQEEGLKIGVEEATAVINSVFHTYPGLTKLMDSCKIRAVNPGWLVNPYHRYRRFYPPTKEIVNGELVPSSKVMAEYGRQAQNYPMQSLVADSVTRAVSALYYRRAEFDVDYKLILQVHDEINALVKISDVSKYVNVVLKKCMVDSVPIYPVKMDGKSMHTGPYYFGNDVTIYEHWGIPLSNSELKEKYNIVL